MKFNFISIVSFLVVTLSFASGCSSISSDEGFRASTLLGEDGKNVLVHEVHAKETWQYTGVSVREGQKILMSSEGLWSGGEFTIDEQTGASDLIWCGAEGCEGYELVTSGALDYEREDSVSVQNGTIQNYVFNSNNLLGPTETDLTNKKMGFLDGLVDGKRVCFSDGNTLLGSDDPGLSQGYWTNKKNAWQTNLDAWISQGQRASIIQFGEDLVQLYSEASCLNPVTVAQVSAIIDRAATSDTDGRGVYLWGGTEAVFEPVYFVDVPAGNYREICNSERDVLLNYYAGQPRHIIEKNECAPAKRSTLVAKIVPEGVALKDVVPIVIGKNFEATPLVAPQAGRLYFRSNDANNGTMNNSGSLRVRVESVR